MAAEARTSPWVRNVALLVGFLILVAIGIWTVVVPELDAPEDPDTEAPTAPADTPSEP